MNTPAVETGKMAARLERFGMREVPKWPSEQTPLPPVEEPIERPQLRGISTNPTLQKQVLEIARNFSPGPSVHTLQMAAQRLAEADVLHAHAVALVEKMAGLPWRDRRFGFQEWQGLASACELWEANITE